MCLLIYGRKGFSILLTIFFYTTLFVNNDNSDKNAEQDADELLK